MGKITPEREWSGHPDPDDPDNYWIDDETGERVPVDAPDLPSDLTGSAS